MSETSPRQVLYALVAVGFLLVVAVLVIGAASAGLVPTWWTVAMAALVVASGACAGFNWRKTAVLLAIAIGLLIVWTVGTLILIP